MKRLLLPPPLRMRLLWLTIIIAAWASYRVLILPIDRHLHATLARAHTLYDQTEANRAILARSASITRARERVRESLRHLVGQGRPGGEIEAALRVITVATEHHDVLLRSVIPGASSVDGAIHAELCTVTVVGHFPDIIAFLQDIVAHDVLIDVGEVHLAALSQAVSAHPLLLATVTIHLDRVSAGVF